EQVRRLVTVQPGGDGQAAAHRAGVRPQVVGRAEDGTHVEGDLRVRVVLVEVRRGGQRLHRRGEVAVDQVRAEVRRLHHARPAAGDHQAAGPGQVLPDLGGQPVPLRTA